MAIEFDCPNCKQLVKTPDAAAGKKGRCPNCKTVIQIPTESTTSEASKKPPRSEAETKDLPIEPEGPFEFPCPSCGSTMRATAATVGKKGRCASCKNVVVIPEPTPAPAGTPARDVIDEDSLIARFGEEEEDEPAPAPNRPGSGASTGAAPQQPANPWAAWGQTSKPVMPSHNPFLSALDDASKLSPAAKLNPYATTAMTKAAERGVAYNWDDDERSRTGLPYEQKNLPDGSWKLTWQGIVFEPHEAFSRMFVDKQVGRSISFMLTSVFLTGLIVWLLMSMLVLATIGLALIAGRENANAGVLIAAVLVGLVMYFGVFVISPMLGSLIGILVASSIQHVCLLATGGTRRGFGTTLKINAYIQGAFYPLCFVPCLNFVAAIGAIISTYQALRQAHRCSTGQAIVVLLLPGAIMLGGIIVLALVIAPFIPAPQQFPGR
jgi:DNA-directed RNA polymerase subunit M/transcription elongation factor TFIIS